MKRLFVCIDLPESIAAALAKLNPELRGLRWVREDQMHLTLSFLGNISADAEEVFREKLGAICVHKFFLNVAGLGTFPSRGQPKIIWIGVGTAHPHLFQLQKRIQEAALAANIEPDLRPWHPHITLARCNDSLGQQEVRQFLKRNAEVEIGMIHVESFALYSSKLTPGGSLYSRELEVALQ